MAAYLILNACVMVVLAGIVGFARVRVTVKCVVVAVILLLLLTAVFDNLIIGSGIVAYHAGRISGVYIFKAPIEDFAYAIAAVLMMRTAWERLK